MFDPFNPNGESGAAMHLDQRSYRSGLNARLMSAVQIDRVQSM